MPGVNGQQAPLSITQQIKNDVKNITLDLSNQIREIEKGESQPLVLGHKQGTDGKGSSIN